MKHDPQLQVEVRDVAAGLWIWRLAHPAWKPNQGWEPVVASTCVESGGETLVLDPLAPPAAAAAVWERLDARPPTAVVVLKPDHVRHVDLFVRRYGARAFGPDVFFRDDIPATELQPIYPGSRLPGGIAALYVGRCRSGCRAGPVSAVLAPCRCRTVPGWLRGVMRSWSHSITGSASSASCAVAWHFGRRWRRQTV